MKWNVRITLFKGVRVTFLVRHQPVLSKWTPSSVTCGKGQRSRVLTCRYDDQSGVQNKSCTYREQCGIHSCHSKGYHKRLWFTCALDVQTHAQLNAEMPHCSNIRIYYWCTCDINVKDVLFSIKKRLYIVLY